MGEQEVREFLGGPLDGATMRVPPHAPDPELVLFEEGRRIHRYIIDICGDLDRFLYLSPDIVIDDRGAFERWWRTQGFNETAKEAAWAAWHRALEQ